MSQLITAQQQNWTPEQLKLITDVVARNATPDELKLFLYRCKNMGLDPLKPGQVHFIKYGSSAGTIVVGIEGFRSIAARTGKVNGIKRGVMKEDGKIVYGWCEVYRSDWSHPAREEVPFSEYNTGKGSWAKMPETMIKKVAEAAALRMAFPDDLGGVYTKEEMDQAEKAGVPVLAEQPAASDGIQTEEYCCSNNLAKAFPALVRKPISKCDPAILRDAIEAIEKKAKATGKEIPDWAAEFISYAEPVVAAWENGEPQEPDLLDLEE